MPRETADVAEDFIDRAEIVALLFNVSDITAAVLSIERLLSEDNGEEETDKG